MGGDLLRHLVAFKDVLERRDLEAHLVGQPNQHQDFVGAVAVGVDETLAFQHFHERVELKIAPRRQDILAGLLLSLVVLPFLAIGLGAGEGIADDVLDALARRRKTLGIRRRLAALPRDVLAQGELDARQRALEDEIAPPRLAVAKLDDDGLAADRIGAAVQDVGGRRAAGEVAIDVDVGGVEDILHPGHRADRHAALIDRVVRDVRMRVDESGRHELAGCVVDVGTAWNRHVRPNRGDLAVAYQHCTVGDRSAGGGDDRAVTNRHDPWRRTLGRQGHRRRASVENDANQCANGNTTR